MTDRVKYSFLLFCAVLSISCLKIDDKGMDVDLLNQGYIMFGVQEGTKASMLTSLADDRFGVFAYNYSPTTNWTTYKPRAIPGAGFNDTPTIVSVNSIGVCTYDNDGPGGSENLVQWDNTKDYAFFAFWPTDAISRHSGTIEGEPWIEYEIPSWTDVSTLKDVVTADKTYANSRTGSVRFAFHHRLFCIDVSGINVYDSETDVRIKNVKVHFNNAIEVGGNSVNTSLATSVRIPLEFGGQVEKSGSHPAENSFTINNAPEGVTIEWGGAQTQITEVDKHLFLIAPQSMISGTISYTLWDGTGWKNEEDSIEFSSEMDHTFQAGVRYTLQVAFAENILSVRVIRPDNWEVDDDQNIIFE